MGYPQLPLTLNEMFELERRKEICAKHGPKDSNTLFNCALLKKDLERDAREKEKELLDEARHKLNEARHKLTEQRLQAVQYVNLRINALQTAGVLLQTALMQASSDYDRILEARASKPVLFDIVSTLYLAALPEFKVVSRAASFFMRRAGTVIHPAAKELQHLSFSKLVERLKTTPQKLESARTFANAAQKVAPEIKTFAQSLDNQAKDIIEAIKDPLAANDDIDEETSKRFNAHHAKNQIITPLLNGLRRTLVATLLVEEICYRFIRWYQGPDLLVGIKSLFENHGLGEQIKYTGTEFDLFAEVLLYDMLREYVRRYFQLRVNGPIYQNLFTKPIEEFPDYYSDRMIDGLDEAQRGLIYARFGKVPWNDRSRPPVNNYKDLLQHWGGKIVQEGVLRDAHGRYPQRVWK